MILRRLGSALGRYAEAPDPAARMVNTIALVIAGNQPFYPIFVAMIAGRAAWPALLTWLSTPFFAAVPAVARRNPEAGAALLCAAGIGNTVLSNLVLGGASGIPLFYLPCALLCLTVLGRDPPLLRLGAAAVTVLLALALRHAQSPLTSFSATTVTALQHLHAVSVACLTGLMLVLLSRVRSQPPGRPRLP